MNIKKILLFIVLPVFVVLLSVQIWFMHTHESIVVLKKEIMADVYNALDTSVTTHHYNKYGQPVKTVSEDLCITYTYTKDGKLQSKTERDFRDETTEHHYYNAKEQLIRTETDDDYTRTYTYNDKDQLVKKVVIWNYDPEDELETTYSYNRDGLCIKEESVNKTIEYTYDEKGRLQTEKTGDSIYETTRYEYLEDGLSCNVYEGNSSEPTYEKRYNSKGNLILKRYRCDEGCCVTNTHYKYKKIYVKK